MGFRLLFNKLSTVIHTYQLSYNTNKSKHNNIHADGCLALLIDPLPLVCKNVLSDATTLPVTL